MQGGPIRETGGSARIALLVLLLGLAAAAVFAKRQQDQNAERLGQESGQIAGQAIGEFQRRFHDYEDGLRVARDALTGSDGVAISRERFRQYTQDLAPEFPGVRGLGYIARVPRQQEAAFVAQARAQGLTDFSLRQLAGTKGERFVVEYAEPAASNEDVLGLDIASHANGREAAQAALQRGEPTLSGPIDIARGGAQAQQLVVLLLPAYDGSQQPDSSATALRTGQGWFYALPSMDRMLGELMRAHRDYGGTLSDITDPAHPVRMASIAVRERGGSYSYEGGSDEVTMYGRRWRLEIVPGPGAVAANGLLQPLHVALAIAAAGLLLSILAYVFPNNREHKRYAFAQHARMAALVESSHDAIVGAALDGRVTEWNRAATQMFGYSAAEAMGRSLVELMVPFERLKEDHEILQRVARGEEISARETIRRHRDGSMLYVEITASPIRSRRGKVVGAGFTLRDIAERKEAQAEILQQNVSLEQEVEERTAEIQTYTALQQAILANAGYAIIAANPQGIITLFNPAAQAMLGYTSSDVVGKASPEIFHDQIELAERAHVLQTQLGRRIETGFDVLTAKAHAEPDIHEWTFVTRSGSRIPVLLTVSALRRIDGELLGFLGIAADLRERKRREAALETNERKLRSLFELSPLGIVLTDDNGHFVEFNEAFRTLTEYSDEELRKLDNRALIPPEYAAQEAELMRQVRRSGRYGPREMHYLRKDATRVPIRMNGVALRINDHPHVWSLVEDITLQRAAEAVMVDAVAAAEAASKAKSEFLANMSHEIRTPMNAILGMLQLLQKTGLDARQHDYTSKTETAAKALLEILNDILDFSKIEAGRQTLEAHEFELERVLRDISVILGANIGDKDIELVFDMDKRVPPWVIGDSLRLQQVLINLVGNAIKFTEFGEVVLTVKLLNLSLEHASLQFEVRDTGIGIDKDKLATIFDGFSQAEASTTRRFGGTGLGLAISQRLVRLMGGELQVVSERGIGSRFFFTITLDTPKTATAVSSAPAQLRDLRALVVDDNDCARSAIASMIASIGWHAEEAASGEVALELVKQADATGQPYQVIFIDWRMPGIDGWETGRRIRQMHGEKEGDAPLIVMVTAHGRELLAERQTHDHKMLDGFLVKPVTVAMLVDAVADARAGQLPKEPASSLPPMGEERLVGMHILAVDDNPTNQQLIGELLRSEGAKVMVVGGGAQALRVLTETTRPFDVVLMDIQMPDMDGYTATRKIRGGLGLDKLPIIAMTANVLPSDREACLAAGMNDHIGKPFDLDVLIRRLWHWTGRVAPAAQPIQAVPAPRQQPQQELQPQPLPQEVDEPAVLDWEAALSRFGGKRWAYAETLRAFPDAIHDQLRQLEDSLQQHLRDAAVRQLHTIKGIAGMVGTDRLARLAKSLETTVAKTQGEWEGVLDLPGLTRSVDEAIAASRELFTTFFIEGASVGPQSEPVSRTALEELQILLDASNMRALDHFHALETALSAHHSDEHRQMQGALARLDFAAAASVCQLLLGGQPSNGAKGHDDRGRTG
ncbi:CHASE domain-containing hybrid sensor histidine kinase/response regulator [Lysobacter tyrosinilyticus]